MASILIDLDSKFFVPGGRRSRQAEATYKSCDTTSRVQGIENDVQQTY